MLKVKPILPKDWPVLKDVRLRALADAPGAFGTTLTEAEAYSDAEWRARARRFSEMPPATGCIAYFGDAACGLAGAFASEENPQFAGMTSFWVAPEVRGQGVADALVMFLVHWAIVQGFTMLEADVVENNHRAIAFYKRAGFEKTGQSEPFRGDPSKQIIRLARRLGVGKTGQ